ncbi:MAG: hypothetical protein GOMPHAMPRED_002009 [Gomphillus americanus]|uniref:Apple domain-containing protein n=1 Tax=Gomphillus americanus TaxID=1940652 RepID=A0A8H3FCM8_9LECA|nr:MAG: hypothetical protein GOMPHAMPRED_002009 [Gomphillus americanus]
MHRASSIATLGLLGLGNAISTVTVSINTGICPASYSPSLSSSYASMSSGTGTASGSSPTGYTRTPCPAQLGSPYINGDGSSYQLFCNLAIIGSDLPAVDATSLENCMAECDSYVPPDPDTQYNGSYCVAVTYNAAKVVTGNCQLKYNVTDVEILTSSGDSAKLARFAVAPSISSSIESVIAAPTSAPASQSTITPPGSSSTLNSQSSFPTSGAVPSSVSSGAASTSSTSSPSKPSGNAAPCPCPADNNQTIYDSLGYDFQVYCDESFSLLQGPGSIFAASLDDCMLACDQYVDIQTYAACSGAAYTPYDVEDGFNCFLTTDADPYTTGEIGACVALVPDAEP